MVHKPSYIHFSNNSLNARQVLLDNVKEHGLENKKVWDIVSSLLTDRSPGAVQQFYFNHYHNRNHEGSESDSSSDGSDRRNLDDSDSEDELSDETEEVNQAAFTEDEKFTLFQAVKLHGTSAEGWELTSSLLEGRTPRQCKRYYRRNKHERAIYSTGFRERKPTNRFDPKSDSGKKSAAAVASASSALHGATSASNGWSNKERADFKKYLSRRKSINSWSKQGA